MKEISMFKNGKKTDKPAEYNLVIERMEALIGPRPWMVE